MKLAVEFAQMRKVSESMFEVPILRETQILDKSRMGGDGKGGHKIDAAMLHEIAANFSKWPLPVPASAGDHKSLVQRGNEAAAAFIESVFVDGPNLWARIKINDPKLRSELNNDGWRGFSVEIVQDFKLPTVEMKGWALRGGVFTNIPATPTLFKQIAASIGTEGSDDDESNNRAFAHSELRPQRLDKEREMSAEKVAQLEASIADKDGKIEAMEAEIKELRATVAEKKAEGSESEGKIAALEASIEKLSATVLEQGKQTMTEKAVALRDRAINEFGIKPAFFEGFDDDPAKWMNDNQYTVASLEKVLTVGLDAKPDEKPVASGQDAEKTTDDEAKFQTAIEAAIKEDPKLSYDAAVEQIRSKDPELFRKAMSAHFAVTE